MVLEFLRKYDTFIVNNASQISSIESTLRTLTYILPGRFEDAEFASEALFTALNLIGLYHDSILVRAAAKLPPNKKPTPSPHNRYTRSWMQSSKLYQRAAMSLTLLQYTDVLFEMAAERRWGRKVKWKLITMIECAKVACRLLLLYQTELRSVTHPAVPRREIDPSIFDLKENKTIMTTTTTTTTTTTPTLNGGVNTFTSENCNEETWTASRIGRQRPYISVVNGNGTQSDYTDYLMKRVLLVEDVRQPEDLLHKLCGLGCLSEMLFILRPLIYVIAIRRYGDRVWKPWLLSLTVEVLARFLIKRYYKTQVPGGYRWLSTLEKDEQKRRLRLFFYYVLRGPFFEYYTKPKINRFCDWVSNKPMLSLFGSLLRDYQPLWENTYFYTACS